MFLLEMSTTSMEKKVVSHYQIYNQCVEHGVLQKSLYGWSITYEKWKQYVKK